MSVRGRVAPLLLVSMKRTAVIEAVYGWRKVNVSGLDRTGAIFGMKSKLLTCAYAHLEFGGDAVSTSRVSQSDSRYCKFILLVMCWCTKVGSQLNVLQILLMKSRSELPSPKKSPRRSEQDYTRCMTDTESRNAWHRKLSKTLCASKNLNHHH